MSDRLLREKLATRGAASLSDAELIALLVDNPGDRDSIEIAARIIETGGGLCALASQEIPALRMVAGMGVRRAARIAVALELGKRLGVEASGRVDTITNDDDVLSIFRPLLGPLRHEEFWVLYLSTANRVMDRVRVSQGGVAATTVDHRLVVKRALELLCTNIIVVHNHPSGSAAPSGHDVELTDRIARAAALFDIVLLDHIIIASDNSYSFRRAGRLAGSPE